MPRTKKAKSRLTRVGQGSTPLLSAVVYERIRDAIRSGEYAPGAPMSESVLSGELGTSRTPVREALRQLVHEGLVQVTPNRGGVVAAPSLSEVLNVLHLRALVDPEIVRLVADAASHRLVARLTRYLEAMEGAALEDDRERWHAADADLYGAIAEFCPNVLLAQIGLQMRARTRLMAPDSPASAARLTARTVEQRAVVEAIVARDGAAASAAMGEHIRNLRASLYVCFI